MQATPRTGIFTGMMSLESLALDKALRAALQVPAAILMVLITLHLLGDQLSCILYKLETNFIICGSKQIRPGAATEH